MENFNWEEFFSKSNPEDFQLPEICVAKLLCNDKRSLAFECISKKVINGKNLKYLKISGYGCSRM